MKTPTAVLNWTNLKIVSSNVKEKNILYIVQVWHPCVVLHDWFFHLEPSGCSITSEHDYRITDTSKTTITLLSHTP